MAMEAIIGIKLRKIELVNLRKPKGRARAQRQGIVHVFTMSSPSIAPRAVAEDVVDWYLSVLDRSVPHSENVKEHLKQALLVITRRM